MRVERERPPEVVTRGPPVAKAALDHSPVEELDGVARPKPQRVLRISPRLGAAAVAGERPGEHVVPVDAWALRATAPGEHERLRQPNSVIDVEERDVEIDLRVVRSEPPVERADPRILSPGEPRLSSRAVKVAERGGELGHGHGLERAPFQGDRLFGTPACCFDLRERVESRGVARKDCQGSAVFGRSYADPSLGPEELAELDAGPGGVLPACGRGLEGKAHRRDRAAPVAEQLAGVGDAGIRGETGPETRHRVEGCESQAVAAELELGVADHAVRLRGLGGEPQHLPAEGERLAEVMAGKRQRGEPAGRGAVVRREGERPAQRMLRPRQVDRVAGLTLQRLQAEAERGVGASVGRDRGERAGGVRVPERAAAQGNGGGERRHRCEHDRPRSLHGFRCTRLRPSQGEARYGKTFGSTLSLALTLSPAPAKATPPTTWIAVSVTSSAGLRPLGQEAPGAELTSSRSNSERRMSPGAYFSRAFSRSDRGVAGTGAPNTSESASASRGFS